MLLVFIHPCRFPSKTQILPKNETPAAADKRDAITMPSFEWPGKTGDENERLEMNSDMVNPILPSVPAPAVCDHRTPLGNEAKPVFTAKKGKRVTPKGVKRIHYPVILSKDTSLPQLPCRSNSVIFETVVSAIF
jgi:hypothetical protein